MLSKQNFRYYLSAGFSSNIFIAKKITVKEIFDDGSKETNSSREELGYSKFNYTFNFGLGLKYSLSRKLNLMIEPNYVRSLNSVLQDDNAKEFLYSFNINIGTRLMFLK